MQATFVAALQQWSQLRQPQAWLYVVARRLTIREASQNARFGLAADVTAVDRTGPGGWSSTTRQPSVEDVVAARDVVDAIARLAGRKKIVTYLRHVQGWDPAEVADFLGCARSTVNVHAHQGIAALTAMLGTGLLTVLAWVAAAIGHLFQREPVLSTRQKRAGLMVMAVLVLFIGFSPGPAASLIQRVGDLPADVAREVGAMVTR